jgi:deoxyribonuclease V
MILAIDVHYKPDAAKVVCAVLQHWKDRSASHYWIKYVKNVSPYMPGAFYKRELPCMLEILQDVDFATIECIIIDGYVVLDDTGKPGLGTHLYESIQQKVPVIGVAKSSFYQNTKNVVPVLRGESKKPLFVTAAGIALQQAANNILNMYGKYRMPDVLKELDRKTKEE